MIEAWFDITGGGRVAARVPEREIIDLAKTIGLSETDLFSIEIPAGATRWTKIKVLVAESELAALYATKDANGSPSTTFRWRENPTATAQAMTVWLLPPKPLYMVPGAAGVAVVEAVDCRWWWRQSSVNAMFASPMSGYQYGSDGRWVSNAVAATTPIEFVTLCKSFITTNLVGTFTDTGYVPDQVFSIVADLEFSPQCSVAMALDMMLANTNYALMWDTTSQTLVCTHLWDDIGTGATHLAGWMASNKRAMVGGCSPTADSTTPTDPLAALWNSLANAQINQFPKYVATSFPYRAVEGQTYYNNRYSTYVPSTALHFPTERELGWVQDLTIGSSLRDRAAIGARFIPVSRSLVATNTPDLTPTSPNTVAQQGTTPPAWDFADFNLRVKQVLQHRLTCFYGRVAWAGWPAVPRGGYRVTMLRYTVGMMHGQLVPLTLTEGDEEDWLLGPNGLQPDDPKDILFGKGLVHARRLANGSVQIDAAPPNHRVFAAKITGSTQVTDQWRWTYNWVEVEDNVSGVPTDSSNLVRNNTRNGTARNLAEYGSTYGVRIAPGVIVADYAPNTVVPLPICEGTIVMMCESFPTLYPGADGRAVPTYCWFSMPNAVKVTCAPAEVGFVEL